MRSPISSEEIAALEGDIRTLKSAFDMVSDPVLITDANANALYANAAFQKSSGYSLSEIVGRNPGDLWGGGMPKEFYQGMWRTIKLEKKPFVGEVKNKTKDGREDWRELHISPILDQAGEPKFFIAIEPAISDRKRKEEFKEEFISILGHQSMTPLTGIRWALDWLLSSGGLTEAQREKLATVYKESSGLVDLIDDLLFISRLGEGHPQDTRIDMRELIDTLMKNLSLRYPRARTSVSADESVVIEANKSLVSELLSQLLDNAFQYSASANSPEVRVSLKKAAGESQIVFEDNGAGISEEEKPGIISRLFHGATKRDVSESGKSRGLFIAGMIASNYGWSITFDSKERAGTSFTLHIPESWRPKS